VDREYRKWHSPSLGREMELLVFGSRGTPVLVFPTSLGPFYQWEEFGLIEHLRARIEAGWLQLWCIDNVDGESFYNKAVPPEQRVARHVAYERYVLEEVVPAIRRANQVPHLIATGASFGAFHVAATVTRRPGFARKALCLSGAYDCARWLDGKRDGDAYFVNPLAFLPGLTDERYLGPLRATEIVVVTGDEDPNVSESKRLVELLQQKAVPATLHIWRGWGHDWPYWKEMLDVFL
jgi:esterase/lipase superfamily enzyme